MAVHSAITPKVAALLRLFFAWIWARINNVGIWSYIVDFCLCFGKMNPRSSRACPFSSESSLGCWRSRLEIVLELVSHLKIMERLVSRFKILKVMVKLPHDHAWNCLVSRLKFWGSRSCSESTWNRLQIVLESLRNRFEIILKLHWNYIEIASTNCIEVAIRQSHWSSMIELRPTLICVEIWRRTKFNRKVRFCISTERPHDNRRHRVCYSVLVSIQLLLPVCTSL